MLPGMRSYFTRLTKSGQMESFSDPALPGGRGGVLIDVRMKTDYDQTESKGG